MKYIETYLKGELQKLHFEKWQGKLWIHWKGRTFVCDIASLSSLDQKDLSFFTEPSHVLDSKLFESHSTKGTSNEESTNSKDSKKKEEKKKKDKQEGLEENHLLAPLSGTLTKIFAKEGQPIKKGEDLVIMEAMKMEYHLKAEEKGRIKKLLCQEGQVVEVNQVLVIIEYSPFI